PAGFVPSTQHCVRYWNINRRRPSELVVFPLGSTTSRNHPWPLGIYFRLSSSCRRHRHEIRQTMKITVVGIIDRGVPDKERLHLRALADLSLVYYAVIDTVYLKP